MEALIASEGWELFIEVLKEKAAALMAEFSNPGADLDDLALREHRMAMININMVCALPEAMLEDAAETVRQLCAAFVLSGDWR